MLTARAEREGRDAVGGLAGLQHLGNVKVDVKCSGLFGGFKQQRDTSNRLLHLASAHLDGP